MTKPSQFIIHSGYASLKNNDNKSISLTIPNGSTVGGNANRPFYTDVVVGKSGGSIRARGRVNNGPWMPCTSIDMPVSVEIPAYATGIVTNPYTAYIRWINATTVRLRIDVTNYSDQTMYVRAAYTIEFKINTFLPPV